MEIANRYNVQSLLTSDPNLFLDRIDSVRKDYLLALNKDRQSDLGQFFTPPTIAKMMAGMFSSFPSAIHLLDPGAGVGSLSAAFIANALLTTPNLKTIKLTAFEVDPILIKGLEKTLSACSEFCNEFRVNFLYDIRQEDFVSSSVKIINGRNSLFSIDQPFYNYAILNPPYKKINSNSVTKHLLKSIGIETTNLYSAFMWLVMKLISVGGQMAAIVPRSFCNGTYFLPFRNVLLHDMAINRIHIFESRDKAFTEGSVLQENIILFASKTKDQKQQVTITSSKDPDDVDLVVRKIDFGHLVHPQDPNQFIRIIPDELAQQISIQMNGLTTSLKDLGITVSTGRVVDFRARHLLRTTPDQEIIPLIYPGNLCQGTINWPLVNSKKPSYLSSNTETNEIVIPAECYVFVKRFSSKEEKRRVYAAIYDPKFINADRIGIENHLNYFHKRYGSLGLDLAKGLALYLNSTFVDQFFRQFSGHTQVNAADLRSLKYPTESQLKSLGRRFGEQLPSQDEIDRLIAEELTLNQNNENSTIQDPIQAKKKIGEALSILKTLNVPRAQQNDRSALSLLALVNIRSMDPWKNASENLIGITEMMNFFRENYGIDYAPNTRETVRRQTIHQFIQMGLVVANPDDPTRPINSPKTRYLIETKILDLIRSFNTPNWENKFKAYFDQATLLGRLQIRDRGIPMIPVTLPNGEELLLTSGGQNGLIKNIIEKFCPRYTPGGEVVYIGDAGQKLNDKELNYFRQLGLNIDKHGKMPDIIVSLPEKKWLILIEAVTSHGPIDIKRHNELKDLFGQGNYGLVFVTAFETRKAMLKYLSSIAWETEVWISETPDHLIHFNGERFLGPYPN